MHNIRNAYYFVFRLGTYIFSLSNLTGESSICEANIVPIYECFLLALEDYTHDRRGDIGAWVREASMSGLTSLTLLASKESALVPQVCVEAMMPKIGEFYFYLF